jgi:hypothetical protein
MLVIGDGKIFFIIDNCDENFILTVFFHPTIPETKIYPAERLPPRSSPTFLGSVEI